MREPTMVLVSSDLSLISGVSEIASEIDGFVLEVVQDLDAAWSLADREEVLAVLYHLEEGTGIAGVSGLLRAIAVAKSAAVTLVLSDVHRSDEARALLKQGAADYLSRPLDLSRLAYLIDFLTLSARHGRARAGTAPASAAETAGVSRLNGQILYRPDSKLGEMIDQVRRIAPLETTVLLGGETGTGKTRLANVIHQISHRRDKPFLTINCGALSESLIESEMFGHARGAFTGADAERIGKFTAVGGGTLFLDEIDCLPLALQAKLLRVVEERVFEAVGSNRSQPMRARLIIASNRPLQQEVSGGRFRADLFFRLNVIAFELPPLREQPEIIPLITRDFAAEFATKNGRSRLGISAEAVAAMQSYDWPGNVRELRNVIERAVALCTGPAIRVDDLPAALQERAVAGDSPNIRLLEDADAFAGSTILADSKAKAESGSILEALKRNGGNRMRAAADLGISRMTLYNKINKYGLAVSQ